MAVRWSPKPLVGVRFSPPEPKFRILTAKTFSSDKGVVAGSNPVLSLWVISSIG
jgi:hypothetical protein